MKIKILAIVTILLILLVSFSAVQASNILINDGKNLPDLAFTSYYCKRDRRLPLMPGHFHLVFTVTNVGDAPAYPTNGNITILHPVNNQYTDAYHYTYSVGVLEPGESFTYDSEYHWAVGYKVGSIQTFIIDPDNDINEKDEVNNERGFTISLIKKLNLRKAPLIVKMFEHFPFFEKILKMVWAR
jgi:hypothetical protein